jgi:hypothetical protein
MIRHAQLARTRADIIASLPGSIAEIIKRSGYSLATVSRNIAMLRAEKEIHIARWGKPPKAGRFYAVFAVGSAPDAPRLEPVSNNERMAKVRRIRKETGAIFEYRAKQRGRYHAKRATYRRDPLLAALYGVAA